MKSDFEKFRRRNGLFRLHAGSVSGYLLEAKFRRLIAEYIQQKGLPTAIRETGLSYTQLKSSLRDCIIEMSVNDLLQANQVLEEHGLPAAIRFIFRLKGGLL